MLKEKNKILIIGTIPPPIGGVTIHVSRLMEHLDKENFSYDFIDYKRCGILKIFKEIKKNKIIHIHVNNILFLFTIVFYARMLNKKIIFTMHYDINTIKNFIKKQIFSFCLKMIDIPIVLNEDSLNFSLNLNTNTVKISSFLPPLEKKPLPRKLMKDIEEDKKIYDKIFATNAWKLVFNKQGKEVYGIFSLIELFKNFPNYKLYISNSNGDYEKYIRDNKVEIQKNIKFISFSHSFFEILKFCDGMIRNTITDGDAISIKEALCLDKKVFATNVVSRSKGVFCYKHTNELADILNNFEKLQILEKEKDLNGFPIIVDLYKRLLV